MTYLCTNGTAWGDFKFDELHKLQNNFMVNEDIGGYVKMPF